MRSKRAAWLVPALAVPALAVPFVALVRHGTDGVAGPLQVLSARGAVLVSPSGGTRAAAPGTTLSRGEVLRTTADGAAVLGAGRRTLYLGGDALLRADAAAPALVRGQLVLDDRRAGAADLRVGDTELHARSGAVVRAERLAAVRIGTLQGGARLGAASGAVDLPPYHQVLVAGPGPAGPPGPLVLRDDAAERQVVPDLVADDEALARTAGAVDASPEGVRLATAARSGLVLPAALTTPAPAPHASEVVLPLLMGRADAPGNPARATATAERARALRAQDGSWGVVARLVGTTATAVAHVVDALLGPTAPTPGGTVLAGGPVGGAVTGTSAVPTPAGGVRDRGSLSRPGAAAGGPGARAGATAGTAPRRSSPGASSGSGAGGSSPRGGSAGPGAPGGSGRSAGPGAPGGSGAAGGAAAPGGSADSGSSGRSGGGAPAPGGSVVDQVGAVVRRAVPAPVPVPAAPLPSPRSVPVGPGSASREPPGTPAGGIAVPPAAGR